MGDLITGLAHVNLNVTCKEDLATAGEFWSDVLGLKEVPVPNHQLGVLRWFEMPSGQQVHISVSPVDPGPTHFQKTNHPCFQLKSPEALQQLHERIWEHHKRSGSKAAVYYADEPTVEVEKMTNGNGKHVNGVNGSVKEKEKGFPERFFVRDFVGHRIEFSL